VFNLFDKDGSGTISVDEIAKALRSLGMEATTDEIKELMREADNDYTGQLDFNEFISFLQLHKKKNLIKTLRPGALRAFKAIDVSGDGTLSREEILAAMH
jgi:calmodulin